MWSNQRQSNFVRDFSPSFDFRFRPLLQFHRRAIWRYRPSRRARRISPRRRRLRRQRRRVFWPICAGTSCWSDRPALCRATPSAAVTRWSSRKGTHSPSQRLDPFLFALSIGASSFHISLRKERHVFCCFVPFFIDVQVLFFNLVEFIHFPPVPLIHLIGFFAGFNLKEVQWFVFFSFSLTPSPSYSILVVLLADSALF